MICSRFYLIFFRYSDEQTNTLHPMLHFGQGYKATKILTTTLLACMLVTSSFSQSFETYGYVSELRNMREKAYQLAVLNDVDAIGKLIAQKLIVEQHGITDSFVVFHPKEILLLQLLSLNIKTIAESIVTGRDFLTDYSTELKKPEYSLLQEVPEDNLLHDLLLLADARRTQLLTAINSSDLTDEQKTICTLYTRVILQHNNLNEPFIPFIDSLSQSFVKRYPQSPYNGYVTNMINPEFRPSHFGVGAGIYTGVYMFTGQLGRAIGAGGPIGGSITLGWYRIQLQLNIAGSIGSKFKKVFYYESDTIPQNTSASVTSGDIVLGIAVVNRAKINIVPFAGLGGIGIGGTYSVGTNNDTRQVYFSKFPSLIGGLCVDWKFNAIRRSINTYRDKFMYANDQSYWYLRFRAGYQNPMLESIQDGLMGEHLFFQIGIGAYTNPQRLVRK